MCINSWNSWPPRRRPCHLALPFRFETFGAPSSDAGPSQAPSSAGYPLPRKEAQHRLGKTDSKDRQLGTSHIAKIDLYIVGIKVHISPAQMLLSFDKHTLLYRAPHWRLLHYIVRTESRSANLSARRRDTLFSFPLSPTRTPQEQFDWPLQNRGRLPQSPAIPYAVSSDDDIAQSQRCLQRLFCGVLAMNNGLAVFLSRQQ